MKFRSPSLSGLRGAVDDGLWTVIRPLNDTEVNDSWKSELEGRVLRTKDGEGKRGDIFYTTDENNENGEEIAEICELDIDLLSKVLYEHRRYVEASGFSDAEMDVLRAVEFHSATRVGVDEIMESTHTSDLAESTIYKHLKSLVEKELLKKVRPGVYRYVGP